MLDRRAHRRFLEASGNGDGDGRAAPGTDDLEAFVPGAELVHDPVPLFMAASGPHAAKLAGRLGDGFICTRG